MCIIHRLRWVLSVIIRSRGFYPNTILGVVTPSWRSENGFLGEWRMRKKRSRYDSFSMEKGVTPLCEGVFLENEET